MWMRMVCVDEGHGQAKRQLSWGIPRQSFSDEGTAHPRRPMAEHQVAGRNMCEDGVHAAAIAAPLVVQLAPRAAHFQRQFCDDHLGRPHLVCLTLIASPRGVPHDEICTADQAVTLPSGEKRMYRAGNKDNAFPSTDKVSVTSSYIVCLRHSLL